MANTKGIDLKSHSARHRLGRQLRPETAPTGASVGRSGVEGVNEKASESQAAWSKYVLWINPPAHWIYPATACGTPKRH